MAAPEYCGGVPFRVDVAGVRVFEAAVYCFAAGLVDVEGVGADEEHDYASAVEEVGVFFEVSSFYP